MRAPSGAAAEMALGRTRTFVRGGHSSQLFGVDIDNHLLDMRKRMGIDDVPYVVGAAADFLRASALATPGLFRQQVEPEELAELRKNVEAAYTDRRRLEYGTLTRNAHAVAALMKAYLKELPRPLLSTELYPYFLAARNPPATDEQAVAVLKDLLSRLPQSFYRRCVLHAAARLPPRA